MKHENRHGTSRPAQAVKTLLAGVAMSALLGLSINAQAQTCTVGNWDAATGVSDADTGTQDTGATSNRRFGGPCGLRVPVAGAPAFVTDNSPTAEGTYIARFYGFFDSAGASPVVVFAAADGTDTDQVQVWYNVPTANDLTMRVFRAGGSDDLTFADVGTGWHSVELVWEAAAAADVRFSVNGAADLTVTADTSGITLASAHLGNVDGAGGGTSMDFDAFDSRRISRPGRLCPGLTDEARAVLPGDTGVRLAVTDALAIFNEFATNGNSPAAGMPDFDENGSVNPTDVIGVFNAFATNQNECGVNIL
ncbi:hypothetical protein [Wenzhouxiangella marina]|uniref:Uncharacterized protein n=1 Tax=Wenzhouxiangella marina TaxID=1579979 RepID=A0A0K0XTV2_9GAMM|nr:hypothetical protein [Wenzhouxiangella marina]AKS41052.1 hypothetical protein WM2015_671 [Wenzhouxiangella marina]MBB6087930.1 hypothetical protein [Wenzhouxiangella marina]